MSIRRSKSIKFSYPNDSGMIQVFSSSNSKGSKLDSSQAFRSLAKQPRIKKIVSSWDLAPRSFTKASTKENSQFQIRNPVLHSKEPNSCVTVLKQLPEELESKVVEIEEITRSVGFTYEVFKSYREIFSKIIEKSSKNKEILKKVKTGYETWIKLLTNVGKNFETTQDSIKQLNDELEKERKQKISLIKKINDLTAENSCLLKENENAKKEVQEIFKNFGLDFKESLEFFRDSSELKISNSFKFTFEQTLQKIMRFFLCFEKTVYKIFNALKSQGCSIESILKNIGKNELEERWKQYNQQLALEQCNLNNESSEELILVV